MMPNMKSFIAWLCPVIANFIELARSWLEAMTQHISKNVQEKIINIGKYAETHPLNGNDIQYIQNNVITETWHLYWVQVTETGVGAFLFFWLIVHTLHLGKEGFHGFKKYVNRIRPMDD